MPGYPEAVDAAGQFFYASVAQWIEHRPPEPGAEVRFLSDAFSIYIYLLPQIEGGHIHEF